MRRLLFTLLLILPYGLRAQYFEFGIGTGVSVYNGDLSPSFQLNMLADGSGVFQLFGGLNFCNNYTLRLNFLRTKVGAEDRYGDLNSSRELSFSSTITEFSILGEVNPIQLLGEQDPVIYPYLMAGIGAFHFDPMTEYRGFEVHLRKLGTEGQGIPGNPDFYTPWSIAVPLGIGFKVRLDETITMSCALTHRLIFTDYLDDVSGAEVDYLELLQNNGSLAAKLSHPALDPEAPQAVTYTRGGSRRDGYYIASIKLAFALGGKKGFAVAGNRQKRFLKHRCHKF